MYSMDRLYAPWRSTYVKKETTTDNQCPFCVVAVSSDDAAVLVVARYAGFFVMMNKFPYNTGHLLVIPVAHVAGLEQLTSVIRSGMMDAVVEWSDILKKRLGCQGFNVGFNLGVVSGGSIPGHLHMHIVPRWQGDTNFLTTIGDVKLISSDLNDIYKRLIDGEAL